MVGRVVKPHGVHGELMVDVSTDSADLRFAVGSVLFVTSRDGSVSRTLTVTAARPHSGRLLVCFEDVADRDAADALRNAVLCAHVTDLPPIEDPDEFYDHQLEGLAVLTVTGDVVGTVREIMHGAGGELLVVDRAKTRKAADYHSRAAMPQAIGEKLAHQQRCHVPARVTGA